MVAATAHRGIGIHGVSMSRIHDVVALYSASRAVAEGGVSLFAVGDPAGAHLNAVIRRALRTLGEERGDVWTNLLQAANALRWRRMTQPQPSAFQPVQGQIVEALQRETERLRGVVGDELLLDELEAAARTVAQTDSPVGTVLLESILEVGAEGCVVVACNGSARVGLRSWLEGYGVVVLIPSELRDLKVDTEQGYVVAPPAFVPSSIVMAPATREITFVVPAWFGNRSVHSSVLGPHSEGRISIDVTVHELGDTTEPAGATAGDTGIEDTYVPQPIWSGRVSADREPGTGEVEAWKVLLGGGLALWLDDGERIRSLEPRQPKGDRVEYSAVSDVVPGTYLVLREGETERGVMYEQARRSLGPRADGVLISQDRWKKALQDRLKELGAKQAATELSARGVRSARQVRAWADPRLICPQRDADFAVLLDWLGEPLQPAYANAMTLRHAVYKASAELRRELEAAVGRADLAALEQDGFLRLDIPREGFHGMIVTRVLARSPYTEIVPRTQIRVPIVDRSVQWLD